MANDELMADCEVNILKLLWSTYFGAICGVCMCPYYDVTSTQYRFISKHINTKYKVLGIESN